MNPYALLRNWVDGILRDGVDARAIFLPAAFPFLLPTLFGDKTAIWLVALSSSAGWLAFVAWRGWLWRKGFDARRHALDNQSVNVAHSQNQSTKSVIPAARERLDG